MSEKSQRNRILLALWIPLLTESLLSQSKNHVFMGCHVTNAACYRPFYSWHNQKYACACWKRKWCLAPRHPDEFANYKHWLKMSCCCVFGCQNQYCNKQRTQVLQSSEGITTFQSNGSFGFISDRVNWHPWLLVVTSTHKDEKYLKCIEGFLRRHLYVLFAFSTATVSTSNHNAFGC